MTLAAPEYEPSAMGPLSEILETYGQCLDLSRDYIAAGQALPDEDDFDVDLLRDFIHARADLFSVAETSFSALSACAAGGPETPAREELTQKVVALLEEMTEVEEQLSNFLGDRLEKMRSTIRQMQQARPVFKRYGHLGGNKMLPSRINRHG